MELNQKSEIMEKGRYDVLQRMVNERDELIERLAKLEQTINMKGLVEVVGEEQVALMKKQQRAMREYLDILIKRSNLLSLTLSIEEEYDEWAKENPSLDGNIMRSSMVAFAKHIKEKTINL